MLGIGFFRTNLLRKDEALACFDAMVWLIQSYGPPKAPKVPSPLCRTPLLTDIARAPSDSRPPMKWAESVFADIKRRCAMESWAVQLEDASNPKMGLVEMTLTPQSDQGPSNAYQVDKYGRPVFLFHAAQSHIAGHFATQAILKLSALKRVNYTPPAPSEQTPKILLTLISAAHSGQGFHLLPMSKAIRKMSLTPDGSSHLSKKQIQKTLLFNACLGLRALNRSPEQIIAAYGCLTRADQRRKIVAACHQIDTFDSELKTLQMMCATPRRRDRLEKQAKVA